MTDTMTITGLVATAPRNLTTTEGYALTSFRLASNRRKFDRQQKAWVDAGTNWYTVSAYRQLATNVGASVQKGDRVIVTGRLRIRDWESGERRGTNIELDADSLGHDLFWGTSVFTRVIRSASVEATTEAEQEADPEDTEADADSDAETDGDSEAEFSGSATIAAHEGLPVPF